MRLDNYLTEIGLFDSRTKAKQAIERGEIFINGVIAKKSSLEVSIEKEYNVERKCSSKFVSLGGFKIEKALNDFNFNVNNFTCADFGASTGGFTDCLISRGAKKVYAIDLNDNLLHNKLKEDKRVVPIIKNAKNILLSDFDDELDLIVADLSFISISNVVGVISSLLSDNKFAIILIKPQFETGEKKRFKNGIIKDKKIHHLACKKVYELCLAENLVPQNITIAPINQGKNVEFLILLEKNGKNLFDVELINNL